MKARYALSLAAGAAICAGVASAQAQPDSAGVEAATAAALALVPEAVFAEQGIAPEAFVEAVLAAADPHRWRPIATAPHDRDVLLGVWTERGFMQGVGFWEVLDELDGGVWTPETWWGAKPTHWAPIPAPPPQP